MKKIIMQVIQDEHANTETFFDASASELLAGITTLTVAFLEVLTKKYSDVEAKKCFLILEEMIKEESDLDL